MQPTKIRKIRGTNYVNAVAAASIIGVSANTMNHWGRVGAYQDQLEAIQIGKRMYYSKRSVEQLAKSYKPHSSLPITQVEVMPTKKRESAPAAPKTRRDDDLSTKIQTEVAKQMEEFAQFLRWKGTHH